MSYAPPGLGVQTPPVLSLVNRFSAYHAPFAASQSAAASATGPAANQAIYVPFIVPTPSTFTRGWWWNGSVATNAGNVSVGIYDESGARLATTGAVAASGNSVIQSAAFTASVELVAGTYYMAILFSASAVNSTTAFGASASHGRACGLYTQATGASPLPATATFAAWSSQVLPYFGIAQTSFAI